MDIKIKQEFIQVWKKYFNNTELPIALYYTDDEYVEYAKPRFTGRCVIAALSKVRNGRSLRFDVDSIGCPGGK